MGVVVRQALTGIAKVVYRANKVVPAFLAAFLLLVGSLAPASANSKYAGIVIDAKTGNVLYESSPDALRYPASLTKMMTLYLAFEALKSGQVSKNTRMPISRNAAAEPPSKLGLKPGSTITVEDAIYALVTKSANDVATATGEFLGGSEASFAAMMTKKARQLGMSSTTFKNAHGLPNSSQKTTARDMARLGLALKEHFPRYYKYFSTRSFTYNKRRYPNHNRLLGRVEGVDGIKTGYTRASGFNLVSSVSSNGRSIVAVVLGGNTSRSRDAHMADLIDRYLGKASTGNGRDLIARATGGVRTAFASMIPGSRVPLPTDRPLEETVTAYAAIPEESVAIPAQAPSARPAAPVPNVAVGDAALDPVQTASVAPSEGWVIQIASMPSESEAQNIIAKTVQKAPTVLASASGFTQRFEHKGKTFHRARFGGFDSKSAAWGACASLKQKDVSCYAVKQ